MITEDQLRVLRENFEPVKQGKQSHYRELEKIRREFVSKFPPSRIPLLTLDEYVVGKRDKDGETNRDSFCYWVEYRTDKLSNATTDPTTMQAQITVRLGQGEFGSEVRELWNHRCAVTGSSTMSALEASHIKPWADSTDDERLDPNNGLLLTANLHKLFDAGLISFEDSGKMLVSSKLSQSEREIFGVVGKKLSKKPSAETAKYLAYHRTKFLA